MSNYEAATVVSDRPYAPKVTLERDTSGTLTATLEIEGLDPQRDPNTEERAAGVVSFDPLRVFAADQTSRRAAILRLLSAAQRATFSAIASSNGATPQPAQLSAIAWRVSIAVRRALREMDENI